MNQEDKERFARYRKGYIQPIEDNEDNNSSNTYNIKNKIGVINKIDINTNVLIKDVIVNKNK